MRGGMTGVRGKQVHGTANSYNNYGCRCDLCKAAQAAYMREKTRIPCANGCGRLVWKRGRKNPSPLCKVCEPLLRRKEYPHGHLNRYNRDGCRCPLCRAASATDRRERRHRRGK